MICEDLKVKMNQTRRQKTKLSLLLLKTLNDRFNQPVSLHSTEAGAQSQQEAEEGSRSACRQACDVHTHTRRPENDKRHTCVSAFNWNM